MVRGPGLRKSKFERQRVHRFVGEPAPIVSCLPSHRRHDDGHHGSAHEVRPDRGQGQGRRPTLPPLPGHGGRPLAGHPGRPQGRVLRGLLARGHRPGGRRPGRPARRPSPAPDGPGGGREAQVPLRPRRAALVRRRRPRVGPGGHRPAGEGGPQAHRGPARPGSPGTPGRGPQPTEERRLPTPGGVVLPAGAGLRRGRDPGSPQ